MPELAAIYLSIKESKGALRANLFMFQFWLVIAGVMAIPLAFAYL
jgi:hypothetical protein